MKHTIMTQIIDLTYKIEEGMLTFAAPWHPPVSIKQMGRLNIEGRESRKISFGTHTGTHIDAPLHFIQDGITIDQIPLEKLIGDVTIIDFSNLLKNQAITKEMLEEKPLSKKILSTGLNLSSLLPNSATDKLLVFYLNKIRRTRN